MQRYHLIAHSIIHALSLRMKKTIFILALIFLIGKTAGAQSPIAAGGFRFGAHVSPTWSWLRTDDKKVEGVSSNWGVKIAALGEYYFAPNYAITTGIGFGLNQGGTLQNGYPKGVYWPNSDLSSPAYDTVALDAKLHYRINYVEIPLGLRFRGGSNEDSRVKYYFEAPVFTLGFVSKAVGDIRGAQNATEDEIIREDVNGLSLAWGAGAGIEYELATNTTLVVGLSYQKQFTDLTSDKGAVLKNSAWEKEDSKASIGMIALRVGVFF